MVEYSSKKSRNLKTNKYWNKKCVIKRYCSNNYIDTSATQFILECYKAQEMFDKDDDTSSFVFDSVPDMYKTQENIW